MIVHVFENIPHHYHNFMRFFANYASDNDYPLINTHGVYIQSSGDKQADMRNRQTLLELGLAWVKIYDSQKSLLQALIAEDAQARFIFHSLLSRWIWLRLLLSPVNKRAHWVCWGADLYQHILNSPTFKQRVAKVVQSRACQRMLSVKCLNPGDAKLLTNLLGRKQVDVLPYPLVGVSPPEQLSTFAASGQLRLLLGNSAAESNNHIELIDTVRRFASDNLTVYMPLNYAGRPEYVERIIEYGRAQLGEAFVPVTEMLSKQQYDELLASVDGAVFAHDRQQGLYVAYYMMLHGKKLFLKDATSTYDNFQHYGFHVESLAQLSEQAFSQLCSFDNEQRLKNQTVLTNHFTEQALGPQWGDFFQQITTRPQP